MSRDKRFVAAALAAVAAVATAVVTWGRSPAQEQAPAAVKGAAGKKGAAGADDADVAAVRKSAAEFVRAFNAGDAKGAAALWTPQGEYTSPAGETVRGRPALQKSYADFFKKHPKARVEAEVESVRLFGRYTALEEGTLRLYLPGDPTPGISQYSALHVRDGDGWRVASVREWIPDPATQVSLKDLDWLIGTWAGSSAGNEALATYQWGEDKLIIRCRYTLKSGGKVVSSGTQIIGKDPARGLRSWRFDRSGAFGESVWARDGEHWVIDSTDALPDGTEVTAVNLLIPLGRDAFTWQATERAAAGTPLPDVPPVRLTRVRAGK